MVMGGRKRSRARHAEAAHEHEPAPPVQQLAAPVIKQAPALEHAASIHLPHSRRRKRRALTTDLPGITPTGEGSRCAVRELLASGGLPHWPGSLDADGLLERSDAGMAAEAAAAAAEVKAAAAEAAAAAAAAEAAKIEAAAGAAEVEAATAPKATVAEAAATPEAVEMCPMRTARTPALGLPTDEETRVGLRALLAGTPLPTVWRVNCPPAPHNPFSCSAVAAPTSEPEAGALVPIEASASLQAAGDAPPNAGTADASAAEERRDAPAMLNALRWEELEFDDDSEDEGGAATVQPEAAAVVVTVDMDLFDE
jgi:hypothetical protein